MQLEEEGEEEEEKDGEDDNPWHLAWPKEQPQPQPQLKEEEEGDADPHEQWQKEITIEFIADIAGNPSPTPSPTPPGTAKHSPQPRDEAERGMHRYAPLHHSTCHMVHTVRHPLFIATTEQRRKDWEERRRLREGGPEPHDEDAPKTRAEGAPPGERGISVLASLVCLSFFCQLDTCLFSCLPFFLLSFFFLSSWTLVCLFVCFFSEKGCPRAPSEGKGESGAQGA